jgi:hypothetical protein
LLFMSLSSSTLEPAEAVLRRVERDTYSVADVRKALSYSLAGASEPTRVYALAPPSPLARDVSNPMLNAVEQSPYVKALFARVADSEIKADLFWSKIDWLSQAASSKPTGDAAAVAVGRQVAMTMPFLMMAYAALHPWDDSVRQTFDLVMAAMARGYGNSGVASAVKNVLLPFLRALEEQMDTFQKSASATLPKLAAVWAKVAAVAPTKAWLSSAETRRVAFDAGPSAPIRVPKPGKRRPFQVAPAEASAFCVPETAPARPTETGGDEGREEEPGARRSRIRTRRAELAWRPRASGRRRRRRRSPWRSAQPALVPAPKWVSAVSSSPALPGRSRRGP